MIGEDIESVSIGNDRTLCSSQLCDEGDSRLLTGAQSGPDAQCVIVVGVDRLTEDGLLLIKLHHRLGYRYLHA